MERIGSEVRRQSSGLAPVAEMVGIVEIWPDAVGPAVAARAWPARLARDGTLHVSTESSAWAFELSQLAETMLERLRDLLGDRAPAALRFAPGNLPAPVSPGPAVRDRPKPKPTPDDRRRARELASVIDDLRLRELVARAAAASLSDAPSDRPF
jgi:predicted nucleic acid-binding Zn ribbon protein